MTKRLTLIGVALLITLICGSTAALADAVMSWSFNTFNNPNARQVALNIANRQAELAELEDEEKTIMERFQESLERMQMSYSIRKLLELPEDEDFGPGSFGWLPLGNSWLYWEYDGEAITVWYWEDGQWVETPFEPGTKPEPPSKK
jgi:hypothetical protein